jgi:hypothetical protein
VLQSPMHELAAACVTVFWLNHALNSCALTDI